MHYRASHMSLPPELIDMVIDFLYDDRDALRNCSLSCRAMLPSCRVHLFHTVHAASLPYSLCHRSILDRLAVLLQGSPRIGQYISILHVKVWYEGAVETFLSMSQYLRAVEELAMDWGEQSAPQPAALSFIGPLRSLELRGDLKETASVLSEYLITFPSLTSLKMTINPLDVQLDQGGIRSLGEALSRCHIRHIQASEKTLNILLPALQCTPLKTLTDFEFLVLDWEWYKLSDVLLATASSLTTLITGLQNVGSPTPEGLEEIDMGLWNTALRACPLLERFVFYVIAGQVGYICNQLMRIRGVHIKRLDLVIDIAVTQELACLLHLPRVFMTNSHFPELRNLNILLRTDVNRSWPEKHLMKSHIFRAVEARRINVSLECKNVSTSPICSALIYLHRRRRKQSYPMNLIEDCQPCEGALSQIRGRRSLGIN
ncbi:hypothetical protein OBBRIDRAFT_602881 [Obba rivulosa]|uniref:F-box domain-containing protein n=1 Tax=Obba rivulosa TaxID=1052685 RepID=A0A8E2AYG1_9APHY|nr:hypothetical protein OBBRIDRAFT_602881 [Obba rivulosa]